MIAGLAPVFAHDNHLLLSCASKKIPFQEHVAETAESTQATCDIGPGDGRTPKAPEEAPRIPSANNRSWFGLETDGSKGDRHRCPH